MSHASLGKHHPFRIVALGLFAVVALASCEVGWINPLAGDGSAGTTTGTVADAQARFTDPTGVVAIPGGGFYVFDAATCAIYKESRGQTSVYAGTPGTCGDSGDGGPATSATLDNSPSFDGVARTSSHGPGTDTPTPMTLGRDGSLSFVEVTIVGWQTNEPGEYWPDYHAQVRRIAPDGTITAVGTGIASNPMQNLTGITTTPNGTILVAWFTYDHWSTEIDSIAPDGTQTAVASIPGLVDAIAAISDTQVATVSELVNVPAMAVDRVDLTNGATTPIDTYTPSYFGSLAASPDGTIYVGSADTNRVVRIAPDNTVTTIAGDGTADPGTGAQSGDALSLKLTPTGLALTPNNGLLLTSGHVVYRLQDPSRAGALVIGSPLNFFGGGCALRPWVAMPPSQQPTSTMTMTSCPPV
jgi:hypothetical protein